MTRKKILYIVNPTAGTRKKRKLALKTVQQQLKLNNGAPHEMAVTESAEIAHNLAREAAENAFDIVVAVGGDGTVNQIASALVDSPTLLGLIPAGSGNGLAHHLAFPLDARKSVRIVGQNKIRQIDTVEINNKRFISIAGVGFDGEVAGKFAFSKRRGFLSYAGIITHQFATYKPHNFVLTIDGKRIEREAFMVSFANSSQFGYNARISPEARLDDGLVDICILRDFTLSAVPTLVGKLLSRKMHTSPYLEIIRGRHIMLERENDSMVNIDGDPVSLNMTLEITVKPKSLNIIVP